MHPDLPSKYNAIDIKQNILKSETKHCKCEKIRGNKQQSVAKKKNGRTNRKRFCILWITFITHFPSLTEGCYMYLGVGNLTNATWNIKKRKKLNLSWKLQYLNHVTLLLFPTYVYMYKYPKVSYNIPRGTEDVLYLEFNMSLLSLTKLPKHQFSKQMQFRRDTIASIFSCSRWKHVIAFLFSVKPSYENNCKNNICEVICCSL
jgi:hypothetical protein